MHDDPALQPPMADQTFRTAVLTVSDRGAKGERLDLSGPAIRELLEEIAPVTAMAILPDDQEAVSSQLREWADSGRVDLILTTGGTGLSPRDVTPEATLAVVERLVPGIPEAIRARSLQLTDRAMLSRAVAGIRGRTLIINLPGSPRAVRECLDVVLPVLGHALAILTGRDRECARP